MRPVGQAELKIIKSSVDHEIAQAFKSKRHTAIAKNANMIMHDVLSQPPIGWNIGYTQRDYLNNCYKAVHDRYLEEHPPGFVGSFFFGALISSIISWLVKRWLNHIFPD